MQRAVLASYSKSVRLSIRPSKAGIDSK